MRLSSTSTRATLGTLSFATVGALLLTCVAPASAAPKGHIAVTICHSTGQGKGFVQITVDASAVNFRGHGDHALDIIPPVNGFPGLNWNSQGSTTYANGCVPVVLADTDRDGVIDLQDPDDDNDSIPDLVDADDDGDGTSDASDPDSPLKADVDGDTIPDALDPDDDGDGIGDASDPDRDGDSVIDAGDPDVPRSIDSDGDTIPDATDNDDDGDCVADSKDPDREGDGIIDATDSDLDNDGIPNSLDTDGDGDGAPNVLDSDANGDGVAELDREGEVQAVVTRAGSGVAFRAGACGIEPTSFSSTDTDGDGTPNAKDSDNDQDGTPDATDPDQDGDGVLNSRDGDADGDGQPESSPQAVADPIELPRALPADGVVDLVSRSERTDAGQPISARVSCAPKPSGRSVSMGDIPAKEVRSCSITRTATDYRLRTLITAPTIVTVTLTAPAAGNHLAFEQVRTYSVG